MAANPVSGAGRSYEPELSVILCTFNRAGILAGALDALLRQSDGTPAYEVIVVDNNSSDGTRALVQAMLPTGLVRYEFEPEQGLSAARNRGIAASAGKLIAFTDDDVRVSPGWVRTLVRTFQEHPDVDMVGGRVDPEWQAPPPSWLPDAGLAPLAVVDYGPEPFQIDPASPVCLVGANLAVRRDVFRRIGQFSTKVQRIGNGIGSTEDYELQLRVLAAAGSARYQPDVVVRAPVARERLSKRYHRAWHQGHGRFFAIMRDPAFERTRLGTILGVPLHVYRAAVSELAAWVASMASHRRSKAFGHELRLRFLMAFTRQRIAGGS